MFMAVEKQLDYFIPKFFGILRYSSMKFNLRLKNKMK